MLLRPHLHAAKIMHMIRCGAHLGVYSAVLVLFMIPSAYAQDFLSEALVPRLSGDIRLRYQHSNQDILEDSGEALTLRLKGAAEFDVLPKTTFLAEFEATATLIENFNDGVNQKITRPFIPDSNGISLNRFQLVSEIVPKTRVTLGRQKIELDDWRFIGAFPFRQNEQSIDAVRVETKSIGAGILDIGYFNKVLRPFGANNPVGEFNGNSWYANYNVASPLGRVSAFHYAFELETGPETTRFNQSTVTTGIRVFGRRHWDDFGLVWEGSYAVQRDYSANPNDFKVDYGLAQLSIEPGPLKLKTRVEILGDDDGVSLQTPLASLHSFQGLSDQFLQTPPDGLRDYSIKTEYEIGTVGPFQNVSAYARHHWFQANSDRRNYGTEFNASLNAQLNEFDLSLEYAAYQADGFSSNTRSVFFTTQYRF